MQNEIDHFFQASDGRIPSNPFPFHSNEHSQDAETGSADSTNFGTVCAGAEVWFVVGFIGVIPKIFSANGIASFPGQSAYGVREMPEIAEGLPLHDFEQGGVGNVFDDTYGWDGIGEGMRGGFFLRREEGAEREQQWD
jgi:hypothetical protein